MGNKNSSHSLASFTNGSIDYGRWMECIQDYIKDFTLRELAIPGTHDSGCYRMTSAVATPWTACQSLDIAHQLQCGIRYFDLRFGYFEKSAKDQFWIMHHKWSSRVPLFEILNSLSTFLTSNEKEIVILHIKHFQYFNAQAYVKFKQRLISCFDSMIMSRSCDPTRTTIAELWNKNHRVLIAMENHGDDEKLWADTCIPSNWFDKSIVEQLRQCCAKEVEQKHEALWILQTVLSPQKTKPMTVKALAQMVNPHVFKWLKDWGSLVNIIIIDYVNSTEYAAVLVQANIEKRRAVNGHDEGGESVQQQIQSQQEQLQAQLQDQQQPQEEAKEELQKPNNCEGNTITSDMMITKDEVISDNNNNLEEQSGVADGTATAEAVTELADATV